MTNTVFYFTAAVSESTIGTISSFICAIDGYISTYINNNLLNSILSQDLFMTEQILIVIYGNKLYFRFMTL